LLARGELQRFDDLDLPRLGPGFLLWRCSLQCSSI
jgi:hypothetical protein